MNKTTSLLTKQLNDMYTGVLGAKLSLGIIIVLILSVGIKNYDQPIHYIPIILTLLTLSIYAIKFPKLKRLNKKASIKEIDNFMIDLKKIMKYRLKYESIITTISIALFIFYKFSNQNYTILINLLFSITLAAIVYIVGYFMFRSTMKQIDYYSSIISEYKNTIII